MLKMGGGQTRLFTLRIWLEQTDEHNSEWRGKLQDTASGESRYFRDWPSLANSLAGMISGFVMEGEQARLEVTDDAK